ncbi:hypothetical protein [Streptoalloteichus hindustanus]|uniref:Uncharacterized protein n=1 Tax=Streptoalloteichus hindustanus TaxID=2017 RepID=A0A1M4YPM0_STRHI|nr:hypothetical protein [Streptoalloteichus hindustanus]SHF07603.1 hypothetical protein SAMN05444320_102434 [Streptoalloteichus hindustanus]
MSEESNNPADPPAIEVTVNVLVVGGSRRAARTRPDPFSPESEARLCALVVGDRRHGL